MSDRNGDLGPQAPGGGRRRRRWTAVRLGVLLAILAALIVFLVLPSGTSAPRPDAAHCVAATGVPEVRQVSAHALGGLRETVSKVLPQRAGRLYEEGTVAAPVAWTDENPAPPTLSPSARRPAGYEMRWWAPNGDDLVADVLVFETPERAQRFLGLAASTRCRGSARQLPAARPPAGRNLAWVNPDGVVQADLFLARGTHVYRVADAPARRPGGGSAKDAIRPGELDRVFATINVLACLLPAANCTRVPNGTTA